MPPILRPVTSLFVARITNKTLHMETNIVTKGDLSKREVQCQTVPLYDIPAVYIRTPMVNVSRQRSSLMLVQEGLPDHRMPQEDDRDSIAGGPPNLTRKMSTRVV